jgi:hypothetical protein
MKKTVRNIIIPFAITFFISPQVLAGASYSCKMAGNGQKICGSEEKLTAKATDSSSLFSFWGNEKKSVNKLKITKDKKLYSNKKTTQNQQPDKAKTLLTKKIALPNHQKQNTLKNTNVEKLSGRYRFSYEDIPVSDSEDMGTMGVHYDTKPFDKSSDVYMGFGGYGAMGGNRGGFFTGGATLGIHSFLDVPNVPGDYAVDAGFFAGGGGGAEAFPGGGLMIRSHLMLEKEFELATLRYGFSRTDFPNTTNANDSDTHVSIGLSVPEKSFSSKSLKTSGVSLKEHYSSRRIVPVMMQYSPDSDAKKRSGGTYSSDISLLGFQHHQYLNDNFYRTFEVYGAGNGGTDGFAKVLGGIGYNYPVLSWISADTKLSMGMAGGGDIDTGGGLIIQPMAGFEIPLFDQWSLKPMLGKTYAPDGNFSATTIELGLNWTGIKTQRGLSSITPSETNFAIRNKTYFPDSDAKTKNGGTYDSQIHQLGIELSKPVNEYLSLSGSAYGAYSGGVGAYAEGLFGVKLDPVSLYNQSRNSSWSPLVRYEIGVGGGGGMDVGDGLIHQWTLGVDYDSFLGVIAVEFGRMEPLDGGSFGANVLQAGITW